jgi:hypothetical protein
MTHARLARFAEWAFIISVLAGSFVIGKALAPDIMAIVRGLAHFGGAL